MIPAYQPIFILALAILTNCHSPENKTPEKETFATKLDTSIVPPPVDTGDQAPTYYDSLSTAKVDTTTLKGKREYIMNQFLIENPMSGAERNELLDLNYDGYPDYIIYHYGQSGTGIKNRIAAYLYDKKQNRYISNEQLSGLVNPTFYIKKKKITRFYIALGTGEGQKLEWINGEWITTKEFQVDNQLEKTVWQITYPLKNKKEVIKRPYQMIPPANVLETNIDL